MNDSAEWTRSYSIETTAERATIWHLMSDFSTWHEWNAGVREIQPDGPMATGTAFAMTLPDGDVIRSRIIDFVDGTLFTDETQIAKTFIRVKHEVEELTNGRRRISYEVHAQGPQAEEFGTGASADFPDVLKSLVAAAERHKS
jgi:hypothetical protein